MLHELYHTVQCVERGGVPAFLDEYIAHSADTVLQRRQINIHDDIDFEREATQRSRAAITAFGWPFEFQNNCTRMARVAIVYLNTANVWAKAGWWTLAPSAKLYLLSDNRYVHSANGLWFYYAETLDGAKVWRGDRLQVFDGHTYAFNSLTQTNPGAAFSMTLTC